MDNVRIRGRRGSLHFIRFPTCEMGNFLALAKSKGMANLVTTVCATGGGAFKFEENFKKVSISSTLNFINYKKRQFFLQKAKLVSTFFIIKILDRQNNWLSPNYRK